MSSPANESMSNKDVAREFGQKYAALTIGIFVLLLSWLITHHINSDRSNTLNAYSNATNTLKNKYNVQKMALANKASTINQQASGMSINRKSNDDKAMNNLMYQATTWSTWSQYNNARNNIMSQYGLNGSSSFMKNFMPQINSMTDSSGKQYNMIDTFGYNMQFKNFRSSLTKIAGTKYDYFALVTVQTQSKNRAGVASTYDALTYTTDGNGKISHISVMPMTSTPGSGGDLSVS